MHAYFQQIDINNQLPDILKQLKGDQFEECKKLMVEFYNMERNTIPKNTNRIIYIMDFFKNLLKTDIEENLEIANQKLVNLKTNLGISSTSKLVEAFDAEAKILDLKISTLASIIIFIFVILFLFIAFLLIISFDGKVFLFPTNFYFYHFYLSLFLVATGFLTYLIKERTRLVKHQHYCRITSLEIIALSEYVAQLNNNEKTEDLIISLADRYFRGPNFDSNDSSSSQDLNMITSKINEMSKLIEEIRKINK